MTFTFETYHQHHAPTIYSTLRRRTQEADADDILQDISLSVYQALERGFVPRNPEAWLARIRRNKTIDWFRQTTTRKQHEHHGLLDDETTWLSVIVEDPLLVKEQTNQTRETYEYARDLCNNLPTIQQEAVLLRHYDGLQPSAIAKQLNITSNNARIRIHRGLKTLRETLQT